MDNGQPVGVAIGMPMDEMRDKYKEPFASARPQENLADLFYLGEFLLLKEYRGTGLGKKMYLEWERAIDSKKICFCKIDETSLDGFWEKFGFEKCPDVAVTVFWKDVGEMEESPHRLVYWLKLFL